MAGTLILVRHAKAEDDAESGLDFDRRLTTAGILSCTAAMKQVAAIITSRYGKLKSCNNEADSGSDQASWHTMSQNRKDSFSFANKLPGPSDFALWTSSAPRASETAAILAQELGLSSKTLIGFPQLYEADANTFASQVQNLKGTLIIVGHNPFLEEVVSLFTNKSVNLKKASAIALEFENAENTLKSPSSSEGVLRHAHIAWFLQGPDHKRWETVYQIQQALSFAAQRILTNAEELEFDQVNAEVLHQYRVSLRVARSLALFIAPYCKRNKAKELLSLLKKLQAQTSRLREYDVMWNLLTAPDAQRTYADAHDLAFLLLPVRAKERSRFNKYFLSRKTRCAVEKTAKLMQNIAWKNSVLNLGISNKDFCAHFDNLASGYANNLAACDFDNPVATHSIRKQSKQMRYVARDFVNLLGENRGSQESRAEAMQELLGRLCDARVNMGIAQALVREKPASMSQELQLPQTVQLPRTPNPDTQHSGYGSDSETGSDSVFVSDSETESDPAFVADSEPDSASVSSSESGSPSVSDSEFDSAFGLGATSALLPTFIEAEQTSIDAILAELKQ